jgi:cobalt-zinc-cadmium efflux system protein
MVLMSPHAHGPHAHDHRSGSRRALLWVLGLTLAFTVVEVAGGIWTDSLALLADAGHMLSDNIAITLALVAVTLASRPSTPTRSFGLQRAEILAAFVNGLTLVLVSGWIIWEAVKRLDDTPEILGGWMLVVALIGLLVNATAAWILIRSGRKSLNIEAALRHVVADLLGSGAVLVAALVIVTTGWTLVDPLVSIGIALLIVASAWGVLRDSTSILMESTPSEIDAEAVAEAIVAVPGVTSVHDLHVWRITSGFDALAAHVLVGRGEDCHALRREIEQALGARFGISHTTLQVDHDASEALIELRRPSASGRG